MRVGKCAERESIVAADGLALEVAVPSLFEDPLIQVRIPVRGIGEDTPGQRKGLRIELKDGQIRESVVVGIEELIVVDAARLSRLLFAEDPLLVRTKERLRGLALDDAQQGLLATVRARQIALIEKEQAGGQDRSNHQHGHNDAIDADAGGLHRRELAGAVQHAKRHQHGDEYAKRQQGVDHAGDQD